MNIRSLMLGPLQTNCWLVSDGGDGPLIVIDPGGDPERLMRELDGRTVAHVVLTHAHFDHIGAVSEVLAATDADLLIHEADADLLGDPGPDGTGGTPFGFTIVAPPADRILHDGDVINAGDLSLKVLHTPGHTAGGICLYGDGHLFSGDTLFAGSVGRTDFPGGDMYALKHSITSKLASLPDETVVHPGHGPDTTIRRERQINPFFPRA